jgi:hypothetical protein
MREAGFIIIAFGALAIAVAVIVVFLRRHHARAHQADPNADVDS